MVKEELIGVIARDTGYRREMVSVIVDSMLKNITLALSKGDKIKLSGFGAFEATERAARVGRNPLTKEPVPIPARIMPTFRPSGKLKNAVIKDKV